MESVRFQNRRVRRILFYAFLLAFLLCAGLFSASLFHTQNPTSPGETARNFDPGLGVFVGSGSSPRSGVNFAQGDPTLLNHSEIVNVVIFICFDGETSSSVFSPSVVSDLKNKFNGESVSLFDYYRTLSYGAFSVRSVFPGTGSYVYVYRAPKPRSYYAAVKAETGTTRYNPESELLNGAVESAASYFDFTGLTLDANNDGFVDSVSFVVSGAYNNPGDWGHLLWPHAWNLDRISGLSSAKTTSASLGGAKVDSYTLTFAGAFQIGLITHEFGHLVGLPDLYHYSYDKNRLPVGSWDLMHFNGNVPQFTLSYLRGEGYLNFLNKKQVPELTVGGSYELKPVTHASATDVVAYKITVSSSESIWLEYRLSEPLSYDRELPGSGLLVYRVNNTADGNTESRYERASAPDEVFVYRHTANAYPSDADSTEAKEKYDLSRAALSPTGAYTTFGKKSTTKAYDKDCLYLSNGGNTGIVVTVTSQSSERLAFTIDLGDYDCSDVSDSYVVGNDLKGNDVKNEHHVYFGMEPDVSVFLKYKNRQEAVELFDYTLEYDRTIASGSQTAYVVFRDVYGERRLPFTLYVYDVATMEATVVSLPRDRVLRLGEALDLTGLTIAVQYLSGRNERVSYSADNAELWTIAEGLNVNAHGTYDHVRILYGDVAYCVIGGIVVESDLVSLRVDETNTRHLTGANFTPAFHVVATYVDGTEDELSSSDYTLSYASGDAFARTRVVVRAKEDEDVGTETYLYSVQNESVTSVSIDANAFTVNYGEEPSLAGASLSVVFSNGFALQGDAALPAVNYARDLLSTYSPTKVGVQKLVGSIGSVSYSITVTVLPKASDLVRIGANEGTLLLDETGGSLTLLTPMTVGELSAAVSAYSDLTLTLVDAEDGFDLISGAFDARAVGTENVRLTVRTASGVVIRTYEVFLLGDADRDGAVTENDVDFWLSALLSGNERAYPYLDANRDGKYTLTDLVRLLGGLS